MKKKIICALLFMNMVHLVVTFHLQAETNAASNILLKDETDAYLCKEYHALVVGVCKYDHLPVLPNADENAREIAELLKKAGFIVNLTINPTSRELNAALLALERTGQDSEQGILFYYAGMGETRSLADGTQLGYIIPKDCPSLQEDPMGFEKNAISMRDIETFSMKIRARHVLMLFDSSFSGDIFSTDKPALKLICKDTLLPIRQYIIAGKQDEPLPEKSVFQEYLLAGLKGDADLIYDGYITGSELGIFLYNSVIRATNDKQHPQYGLIKNTILTGGDFVLKPIVEHEEESNIGHLYVNTLPKNVKVRILNIKPTFSNGMELEPGAYLLEASLKGYQKQTLWVNISSDEKKTIDFNLDKIEPFFTNTVGMKFVYLKPGNFNMGSEPDAYRTSGDETQHKVILTKGFYMQETEVTVDQFKQFVQATGYKTEAENKGGCWITTSGNRWKKRKSSKWDNPGSYQINGKKDTHPVTCVTWNDAIAFANWLSNKEKKVYSLPTEAEWEYCCRAGTTWAFSFGDCINFKQANFKGTGAEFSTCPNTQKNSPLGPIPVRSLASNQWGLYDMHGNVAEWCNDRYGAYPADLTRNPEGPVSGTERVIRGGHWSSIADGCRSGRRGSFVNSTASDVIGFRLVYQP